jgi:hypothetical protein
MVPDGDIEEVIRADAISLWLEAQQLLLAGCALVGGEFSLEHFRGDAHQLDSAVFRFCAVLELIGIQMLTGGEDASL